MTPLHEISMWIGVAAAIGSAGVTYGLHQGKILALQDQVKALTARADRADAALASITKIEAHLEWMRDAIQRLTDER
jgi:hypothetical protein